MWGTVPRTPSPRKPTFCLLRLETSAGKFCEISVSRERGSEEERILWVAWRPRSARSQIYSRQDGEVWTVMTHIRVP